MNRQHRSNFDDFGGLSPEEIEEQRQMLRDFENNHPPVSETKDDEDYNYRVNSNSHTSNDPHENQVKDSAVLGGPLEPKTRGIPPPRSADPRLISQIMALSTTKDSMNRTVSSRAVANSKSDTVPPIKPTTELQLMAGKEVSSTAHLNVLNDDFNGDSLDEQFVKCMECGSSLSVSNSACLVSCPSCWSVSPVISLSSS